MKVKWRFLLHLPVLLLLLLCGAVCVLLAWNAGEQRVIKHWLRECERCK